MNDRLKSLFFPRSADAALALLLAAWWAVNLVQAAFTELAHDEAYYHMFAQSLDWGYFDHPPMTALLIWLGERLAGGELGVRLMFTVLQPLYLFILWRLIRPADAVRSDGVLFFVISAATLMLQLYGFLAVPDAPLMMTAALFFWSYRNFTEGRRGAWLWMGVAMAAMAYSKYHGALVVLFTIASNPRLLFDRRLYMSGAVAALLIAPHLLWQAGHDWASFAYHLSGRNRSFSMHGLVEYVLNMLVVFNVFYVPLYILAWRRTRPQDAVRRALKIMPPAFLLFFLLSTLRGRVQPQWLIVSVFGLVYVLFDYSRRHPRTRRYVVRAGWVTVALVCLTRVEMIFNPIGLRFEIFDNRASFDEIARIADGRPVIFKGSYAVAAKYGFYTGGEAYCQPDLYYRTHQWGFRDDDTRFAGREVLIECDPDDAGAADSVRCVVLANGKRFCCFAERDFRPTRLVGIEAPEFPGEAPQGASLPVGLRLVNPYDYDISGAVLRVVWRSKGRRAVDREIMRDVSIPAGGAICVTCDVDVPADSDSFPEERLWKAGFALARGGHTYWYNGPVHEIVVK